MIGENNDPSFDSVIEALKFAFNSGSGKIPHPSAMRTLAEQLEHDRQTKGQAPEETRRRSDAGMAKPLQGLDRTAQAAFILAVVGRLEQNHQNLLSARFIRPRNECDCGSLCCLGWRMNRSWDRAVATICINLQTEGDVTKVPGKRGLSTEPRLRRALVEKFVQTNGISLRQLAIRFDLSQITVAKHSEWITTFLDQEDRAAMTEVSLLFDQAGVTGFLP